MDKIRKFVKSHGKGMVLLIAIVMVVVGVRQVHPTNENIMEETVSETAVSGLEVVQELATEGDRGSEAESENASESNMEETSEQPTELVSEQPAEQTSEQLSSEELEVISDVEREPASAVEADKNQVSIPESVPAEPEVEPEPVPMPEETTTELVVPEPTVPEPTPAVCTHSWIFDSYFQEPTCSNGGLENQICIHCGETRTVGGTPTGKHEYIVETEGDCCSEEIIRCTVCNNREVREKNPDNHIDLEDGICYGCGAKVD